MAGVCYCEIFRDAGGNDFAPVEAQTRGGRGIPSPAREKSGTDKPDTKESEALASALNRSAERVQTLWISFLIFALYLAIATSTTTHRMLFLESPIKLQRALPEDGEAREAFRMRIENTLFVQLLD